MSKTTALLNVLLVSGGGFQGLAVLKGLLQATNIRVVVADCHEENVGGYFAHRCRVVPLVSEPDAFLKALLEICEAERIQIIFPSTEFELALLAEHEPTFAARGIHVAVSSPKLLKLVSDKKLLYAFLRRENLPVPEVVDITSSSLSFPVLGKPRKGWGSKGQIILHSAEECARYSLPELQESHVWQPLLSDFTEYSIDFAINLAGTVSGFCIRERVRVSGGFAVISRYGDNGQVREIAERFARIMVRHGGRGIFNLQVIRVGNRCFISDVNPRIGTSAVFGQGVGINLPVFVCASVAKLEDHPWRAVRKPVTVVRYLEELFVPSEDLAGIRGVVFDLDDTLMSQKRWVLDKLRGLYPEFKSRLPGQEVFLAYAMLILEEGNRSKLIDALCEHFGLGTGLARELIMAYRRVCPSAGRVYADVRPLLAELRWRGYRLAVLTNNPPESQRQKIATCGFQDCFDTIVYAVELKAEKPNEAGFREVASRLKLVPNELVMVGDHLYGDIGGALNAGYRHGFLILRPGGFFNFDVGIHKELFESDLSFTIMTSLRDLLRHLKEIR